MKRIEILMVEDNPGDIELMREHLSEIETPCTLRVVTTGDEALDFLARRGAHAGAARPDLVLLDLNLPGRSGAEVLQRIKSDPVLKTLPVVILTSSAAERDVIDCYQHHANAFVTKPVDLDGYASIARSIEGFWLRTARLPPS